MRLFSTSVVASSRLAAVLATTLLGASACGGSSGGPSANGEVTLRFNWWGSDTRHKLTQQVIDAFQKDHPNIKIKGEYGEWAGYWDKLATTVAANDAPDVIQMDEKYLREYADRGALLDLKKADGLDTGKFEPDTFGAGEFDNGLYGLNAGINAFTDRGESGGLQGGRSRAARRQDLDLGPVQPDSPSRSARSSTARAGARGVRDQRCQSEHVGPAARPVAVHQGRQARRHQGGC